MEGLLNFLSDNAIYIVLIIVLIVWTGIFLYMLSLDKRIKFVEKELSEDKNEK
ncbi:MAG: CcmD family protein [Ignavibacteriaceae bacterium]